MYRNISVVTVSEGSQMLTDLKILSRSKLINGYLNEARIVTLNAETLKTYYSYPLSIAARDLGVCSTALKRYFSKAQYRLCTMCTD